MAAPHCGYGSARSATGSTSSSLRLLRDAGLLADEPVGLGGEAHRLAGFQSGRDLELRQQQHLAFVAVVDERPRGERMRRGPLDRAGFDTGRQRPGERRRQAGIARIAPIRVPAVGHLEAQRHRHRLAGHDGRPLADQFRLDMRRLDRRRPSRAEDGATVKARASRIRKLRSMRVGKSRHGPALYRAVSGNPPLGSSDARDGSRGKSYNYRLSARPSRRRHSRFMTIA